MGERLSGLSTLTSVDRIAVRTYMQYTTYKEEVAELLSADHLAGSVRLQVAKQLHGDHRDPHKEEQGHEHDHQQAGAIAKDLEEEPVNTSKQTEESWQSESLEQGRKYVHEHMMETKGNITQCTVYDRRKVTQTLWHSQPTWLSSINVGCIH